MSSQHESKLKKEEWKAHAKVLESINKKKKSFYINIFDKLKSWPERLMFLKSRSISMNSIVNPIRKGKIFIYYCSGL